MPEEKNPPSGFAGMGLSPRLLEQLDKLNFTVPTPIQEQAIPVGLAGKDVIGIAQTGTGKTLAFAVPMVQKLANGEKNGLVILPTRELALQVQEEVHKVGRYFGIKTALLIGGASANVQCQQIRRNPNVVIATPGRLIDHLEQCNVSLKDVAFLVLDEADRMLDMGFEPQIRKILAAVPKARQTFLFSATMPPKIGQMAAGHMNAPVRIEVSPAGTATDLVRQESYIVDQSGKLPLLERLLKRHSGPVLVFTRTKHGAGKLTKTLRKAGVNAAEIHSNRSLAQRREALAGFKSGKYAVLCATDVASRGIDVSGIELVVNFDVPEQSDDYVHRIGRTGRAGKSGLAVTFFTPGQQGEKREIERLTGKEIPTVRMAGLPAAEFDRNQAVPKRGGQGRRSAPERDSGRNAPRRPAARKPDSGLETVGPRPGDRRRFERGGRRRPPQR